MAGSFICHSFHYSFLPNNKDEFIKKILIKGNSTFTLIFIIFYAPILIPPSVLTIAISTKLLQ